MDKIAVLLLLQMVWLPGTSLAAKTLTTATSKSSAKAKAAKGPATTSQVAVASDTAKDIPAYQQYTYYGDRYRDPFIPLNSQFHNDQEVDRPPQIASLLLKGIVEDAGGKIALLTSGVTSYVLRGGRLYDGRNHLMKGISGVFKANSIVLMGSDRTVKELKVTPTL